MGFCKRKNGCKHKTNTIRWVLADIWKRVKFYAKMSNPSVISKTPVSQFCLYILF